MKIFNFVFFLVLFFSANASNSGVETPKAPKLKTEFDSVDLKEFTTLTLNVMPDIGTQLIFPFLLDDPVLNPTLKLDLTNSTAFSVPAAAKDGSKTLISQNTITIVGNRTVEPQLGTLFINIGGYNISIALRTVFEVSDISPSVIFNISKDDREHLITHTVDRYKEALKAEHDKAMRDLDDRARRDALAYVGEVATANPRVQSFKSEFDVLLGGDRIIFYADNLIKYDNFSVLVFEIDNPSNKDVRLDSFSLTAIDDKEVPHYVDGKTLCPDVVQRGRSVQCTFTTTSSVAKSAFEFEMMLSTDIGSESVKW